jgi:hypothetical protein
MTNKEITQLRNAAAAFHKSPSPGSVDDLLVLLAPHRTNLTIQRLIDEVLDYKFLVGSVRTYNRRLPLGS